MTQTLQKIDRYLEQLDEKEKQRNILGKQLPFLYKTEDLDVLGLEDETIESLMEAKKDKDYDAFFNKMLKKYKVKSFNQLSKADQKKFFNEVDKAWKAKKETD